MEGRVRDLWTRLERWLGQNGIDAQLHPGASDADLARLEHLFS